MDILCSFSYIYYILLLCHLTYISFQVFGARYFWFFNCNGPANGNVCKLSLKMKVKFLLQGEMQQLRDKLAIMERTAKSEAQLKVFIFTGSISTTGYSMLLKIDFTFLNSLIKDLNCMLIHLSFQEKYQLRLKVLEEGLRIPSSGTSRTVTEGRSMSNGPSRRQSLGGAENISKLPPNGYLSKRNSFQIRSSVSSGTSMILRHAKGTSKSFDGGTRSLDRGKLLANGTCHSLNKSTDGTGDSEPHLSWKENLDEKPNGFGNVDSDDSVSGLLYDMLQKEVITLRKACHEKDQSLKDKDDAIEVDNFLVLKCFLFIFQSHLNSHFDLLKFRC